MSRRQLIRPQRRHTQVPPYGTNAAGRVCDTAGRPEAILYEGCGTSRTPSPTENTGGQSRPPLRLLFLGKLPIDTPQGVRFTDFQSRLYAMPVTGRRIVTVCPTDIVQSKVLTIFTGFLHSCSPLYTVRCSFAQLYTKWCTMSSKGRAAYVSADS